MVFTAISMTVLLGFLALATDVGILLNEKRVMQSAADCAAVAGAMELDYAIADGYASQSAGATAAAKSAATTNGFTGGSGVTVTVHNGPSSGPHSGSASYVEVILRQNEPTLFMKLFTRSTTAVSARAVAGLGVNNGCIWTLGTSNTDISQTGSGSLNVSTCSIFDNSSSGSALTQTGSGSITAQSIGIVGNYTKTGSGTISPTPVTGIVAASDPLASLVVPSISTGSGCQAAQTFSGSGTYTLNPGCYNGVSITGSGSLTLNAGNYVINGNLSSTGSSSLTLGAGNYTVNGNFNDTGSGSLSLGAGLYITNGNLGLTGSGTLSGTGVSFYTTGQTSITGSSSVNLTAPTSGTYNGVLFFQSRTDSNTISITGSSALNLQGIIYAPDAQLAFTGSGIGTIYSDFVVKSLSLTGSTTFQSYAVVNANTPIVGKASLVE
jgi:Flp pilus assembly protein TadG